MRKLTKGFSPNLTYSLRNPHIVRKAVLSFDSGAYSYTEISELIVALNKIQDEYRALYGLNN